MKTTLFALPLLALLAASCTKNCDPAPKGCVSGTVLANTCMVGTLIQLDGRGGHTIWYDVDGKGKKKYTNVISTYFDFGGNAFERGQKLYFTYRPSSNIEPEVQCLANDAPEQEVKRYVLSNVSTVSCDAELSEK